MIYADTSALVKRVVPEAESAALADWLSGHLPGSRLITNRVGAVELVRAAGRIDEDSRRLASLLVRRIQRLDLTSTAYGLAAELRPSAVRTLDALHIASASELPGLTAFLTYDHRMIEAARAYGLPVVTPT